ncbi:MAG TPA: TonB-dependent receptor [Steroidobacteraceae bacterium]|nr:TonB-dependent receptor [Steroidobacteraceae bacterium]
MKPTALLALTVLSAVGAARAETTDGSIDEVVVVATRAPEPLSKVGSSVTVLDEAAIKDSQVALVADLLAQTPGLSVARIGGVGSQTSVFIRGADSDHTLVVIDGVQINDPSRTDGGFDFQDLLTSDVSRIEILRGSHSTLYGSQAIGGVINIVNPEPASPFEARAQAEGGSHDTGYFNGSVGGKDDALLWRLSANWLGTSGIPTFDERYGGKRLDASQIGGGSGEIRYDFTPNVQLDTRAYYTVARTDFDGYDTPPNFTFGDDNEYGRTSQLIGYSGLTLKAPEAHLTNRVAVQFTESQTRDYDPDAPVNEAAFAFGTETFYGVGKNVREEYQGTWDLLPGYQLVFGAQHERSTIETDSPVFDLSGPMPLENSATMNSGYTQLQAEALPGLTLTAGGRYDRHSAFGGHSTGQLAAAWDLDDGHTILRASFGQGFRAPSLYQLYSNYGDPSLDPELATGWDAGVERHAWDGRLTLSATYFHRNSRNLIEFIDCFSAPGPLCAIRPAGYYANVDRAIAQGVELQATLRATDALNLSANYTLTDTEDRSPGSPTYGNELPRRPRNTANASATYQWPMGLRTIVDARYAARSFDDAENLIVMGGYVLYDLKASYALNERLELYARVENLSDKHYETAYQYGMLGRSAYAGARVKF